MLSRVFNVLKSSFVVARLAWEFNFQNCVEEVLFVWVLVKLFCELFEPIPVLEVPSSVCCHRGYFSYLLSDRILLLTVEFFMVSSPDLSYEVRKLLPIH